MSEWPRSFMVQTAEQIMNVSKLNLRIQPVRRPQDKKAPKRLDVSMRRYGVNSTQVNSYSYQFVLSLVNSYHLIEFSQLVLILVDSK